MTIKLTTTQFYLACLFLIAVLVSGGYHLAEIVYDYKIEQLKTDVELTKYLAIISTFGG